MFPFEEWNDPLSPEHRSTESLSQHLLRALEARIQGKHLDCVDLIISGVEASLWVAEQMAKDLRMCLPKVCYCRSCIKFFVHALSLSIVAGGVYG